MMEIYIMAKTWIYGDNIDTDVIIPARYLNTSDEKEVFVLSVASLAAFVSKENNESKFSITLKKLN